MPAPRSPLRPSADGSMHTIEDVPVPATASRPAHAHGGGAIERADISVAAEAGSARHDPAVRVLGAMSEIADQVPSLMVCGTVLAYGLATGPQPRG